MRSNRKTLLAVLLSFLVTLPAGATIFPTSDENGTPTLAPLIESASPAVVNIATTGTVQTSSRRSNPFENDPFFQDIDAVSLFNEDHEEHITLPEDFIQIASSELTEVEAMRHRAKPIYSVQFHPETSGDQGFKMLENFSKLCAGVIIHVEH